MGLSFSLEAGLQMTIFLAEPSLQLPFLQASSAKLLASTAGWLRTVKKKQFYPAYYEL